MNNAILYSPEMAGKDPRQAIHREFVKLQRVIAELDERVIKLIEVTYEIEKRVDEMEARQ